MYLRFDLDGIRDRFKVCEKSGASKQGKAAAINMVNEEALNKYCWADSLKKTGCRRKQWLNHHKWAHSHVFTVHSYTATRPIIHPTFSFLLLSHPKPFLFISFIIIIIFSHFDKTTCHNWIHCFCYLSTIKTCLSHLFHGSRTTSKQARVR